MASPILCVEDDSGIGCLLTEILEQAGYVPEWVNTGEKALEGWHRASLIVLDLMLPGIDGLTVCRSIREQDAAVPIIMLTALAGTRDVVEGLEIGADDYITKPFDADILLARIHALLRRRRALDKHSSPYPPLVIKDLEINVDDHSVKLRDQQVSLTTREFALLAFFARHPGKGFSRGELLDAVWGPEFDGFDHTVNTHINRLRNKIELDPSHPQYILTVWGIGYRFTDVPQTSSRPSATTSQ
ncbi:response regulator transcription factor [Chromohalobacter sp. HP20-39]|uniref:response regulator transcription factor n=1 Tax=Chromohalobacter sp. HP20-39 TaxID=3079306 RepID=UPI00294B76D9|nr:response regulator transcription factor [Chromohalobacter sp. HP20-39]MDV6318268.1 response regulator transcription factor [Chromohalobacter sp. HP20-39]